MIPELPQDISSDGHELWDWAKKFSDAIHHMDRLHTLQQKIRTIQNECGSCQHWMHQICPREKPHGMSGYRRGPSMSASICQQFTMNSIHTDLLAEWVDELATLEGELPSGDCHDTARTG